MTIRPLTQDDLPFLRRTLHAAASGAFGKPQSSDGRGIDHATENLAQFDPLIGHLIGVYMAVSS